MGQAAFRADSFRPVRSVLVGRSLLPITALTAVGAAFLLLRPRPLRPRPAAVLRIAAVVPLLTSGALHLFRSSVYLPLIPPPFPRAHWFVAVTGLPELLGAVGLLAPATRKPSAVCLAVYLIAIFPANVYVAGQTIGGLPMPSVPVRTAMQAAYMLLILFAGFGLSRKGTFGTSPSVRHP